MVRKKEIRESWQILLDWDKDSKAAERLAAICIEKFGYLSIDPQHPRGGRDGGKDIICCKNKIKFICCVYFPRGKKNFTIIKKKFLNDLLKNKYERMIFFTNQELTISNRKKLLSKAKKDCEIIHVEKINNLLNQPEMYGIRLEFLDIEMEKEEQLAFYATNFKIIEKLRKTIEQLFLKRTNYINNTVIPQPVSDTYLTESLYNPYGDRIHFCSHCGYGYKVKNIDLATMTTMVNSSLSIQCPKCENIEYYKNFHSI